MSIRLRRSKLARACMAAAALAVSLGTALALSVAPARAATAPDYDEYSCSPGLTRFFQLRNGNENDGYSELWVAGITSPGATNYVDWKKAVTFSTLRPVAIAARETVTIDGGPVAYLYLTEDDGSLWEGRWGSHLSTPWSHTRLGISNAFRYTRLAYEEEMLWGVKNGDLYKQWVPDNLQPPRSGAKIADAWGNPSSFFGVSGSQFALGFTGTGGALRYMTPAGSVTTLRDSGYDGNLVAGVGDGLTYRFYNSQSDLRRFTIGAVNGLNTPISSFDLVTSTNPATPNLPITAVSDQCSIGYAAPLLPTSRLTGGGSTGYDYWEDRGGHPHYGEDFPAPSGTPVYAAHAGTVAESTNNNWWGGPNLIKVTQGSGSLTTWYAHMQDRVVSTGQHVVAGQLIGHVGSMGQSTGPHLHLEVHTTNTDNPADFNINPNTWLASYVF